MATVDPAKRVPQSNPPIDIRFGKRPCRVERWNSAGFALASPQSGLAEEDVRNARITISVGDCNVSFEIPCQVTRANAAGAIEFKFLGSFSQQACLLHRVIEDHRAGHNTHLATMLTSPPTKQTSARGKRAGIALVCALGVTAGWLMTLVAASLFTVHSRLASVVVDGSVLRAPLTGILDGEPLVVGTRVKKDQPLFRVLSPDFAVRVAETSAELKRLQVMLDYSRIRFANLKQVTSTTEQVIRQQIASVKQRIGALDSQISMYANFVDKKQQLARLGYNSTFNVDEKRIDLEGRRQERDRAEADNATSKASAELMEKGILPYEFRDGVETVESMRLRVSEAEAAVVKAQKILDALAQVSSVLSPCDCILHAVAAKPGELIEVGTPVYSLRVAQGVPIVEALFLAEDIEGATVGSQVSISLVSGRIKGRLEQLSYDDQPTLRIGLTALARAPTGQSSTAEARFVRATILLDSSVDASLVSTPAEVAIWINPARRTLNRLQALSAAI